MVYRGSSRIFRDTIRIGDLTGGCPQCLWRATTELQCSVEPVLCPLPLTHPAIPPSPADSTVHQAKRGNRADQGVMDIDAGVCITVLSQGQILDALHSCGLSHCNHVTSPAGTPRWPPGSCQCGCTEHHETRSTHTCAACRLRIA